MNSVCQSVTFHRKERYILIKNLPINEMKSLYMLAVNLQLQIIYKIIQSSESKV